MCKLQLQSIAASMPNKLCKALPGKRVLITGASSGIGEQMAYFYSKHGASIVIVARRLELLEKVAAECSQHGAKQIDFVSADMGRPEDRERVVQEVQRRLGGLDHLILNHAATKGGFFEGTPEAVDRVRHEMEVNFISFVDITSRALPMLKESDGNIGIVSSVAGKFAHPTMASYVAGKFALQGFFSTLRQELKINNCQVSITLCVLGYTATETATANVSAVFEGTSTSPPTPAPVDGAVLAIITGVVNRTYEVYYPKKASLMTCAHKLMPGFVEDYGGKMLKRKD